MPSFVTATTYSATTSATSHSISIPSGSVGDVLLLFAITGSGSGVISASGFTALTGDIGNSMDCNSFYRVTTGSEGATQSVSLSPTYSICMIMARYTDVLTTGTPYHDTGSSVTTTAATTSSAQAALTGVAATDLVVAAYMAQDSTQGAVSVGSPAGWTSRTTAAHVSGGGGLDTCGIRLLDKVAAADHPTTTTTQATQWGVVNLALIDKPAAVSIPPQQSNLIARRRASNF